MKRQIILAALLAIFGKSLSAQKDVSPLETELIKTAHNVEFAVAPLMYWGENGQHPENAAVIGTGFFINKSGYFITAAHVVDIWKADSPQLTIIIRQGNAGGGGAWFDVIEKDVAHDLALCKTQVELTDWLKGNKSIKDSHFQTTIATLAISAAQTQIGRFVAIAGFPLGSWNPTIQLGTIAATETINPNISGVPAGRRQLLQISVAGNKGNSGSPVIELSTGKVIGVVVQAIPAPLYTSSNTPIPLGQSSGVMLAVPAMWVQELLKRHNVTSTEMLPIKSSDDFQKQNRPK